MRFGLLILAVFAAAWACAGLLASNFAPAWTLIPIAISAALIVWAIREPAAGQASAPHVGRLVGIWSAVEGIAIFLVAGTFPRLGHVDLIFPAIAIIVGLHFLPLARGIPVRSYYASGFALILLGLVGMVLPATERPLVVGVGAALILWCTCAERLMGLRRNAA